MFNKGQLRDAFNREVIPNRMQPSPQDQTFTNNNNFNYNLYNSNAPTAYDSFGSSSGSSSYATFNSNVQSTEWPSQHTSPSFTAPAPACAPCSGQNGQINQYGGQYSQQHSNQFIYGNQQNEYDMGQSNIASQTTQLIQQNQPASYAELLHELNNISNGNTNHVDNRSEHLTATHESVNDMLVNYLAMSIKHIGKQLKFKPDWIDLSPDGGASWKYSSIVQGNSIWSKVFTKIEIIGERKAYKYPLPYIGNIITTTRIKIDCEILPDLLREFPMMSYCQATKNLQITMDSLEHNLAMLALICAVQREKISINRIKHHELAKKYMLLTTPGHRNYQAGAKYSLIRQIRK